MYGRATQSEGRDAEVELVELVGSPDICSVLSIRSQISHKDRMLVPRPGCHTLLYSQTLFHLFSLHWLMRTGAEREEQKVIEDLTPDAATRQQRKAVLEF